MTQRNNERNRINVRHIPFAPRSVKIIYHVVLCIQKYLIFDEIYLAGNSKKLDVCVGSRSSFLVFDASKLRWRRRDDATVYAFLALVKFLLMTSFYFSFDVENLVIGMEQLNLIFRIFPLILEHDIIYVFFFLNMIQLQ